RTIDLEDLQMPTYNLKNLDEPDTEHEVYSWIYLLELMYPIQCDDEDLELGPAHATLLVMGQILCFGLINGITNIRIILEWIIFISFDVEDKHIFVCFRERILVPNAAPIYSTGDLAMRGLNSLIALGAWILWNHQNRIVFDGLPPSVSTSLGQAREEQQSTLAIVCSTMLHTPLTTSLFLGLNQLDYTINVFSNGERTEEKSLSWL
ncbi:hypothetical protein ACJX0J_017331, partial [Zea mays]